MSRTITEKKDRGNFHRFLLDKPQKEKEDLKVKEFCKVKLPKTFMYNGFEITPYTDPKQVGDLLQISVSVKKDGEYIFVDNPLLYKNPPALVHDGTFYLDEEGKEQPNFKEDFQELLQTIIGQTVELSYKLKNQ